MASFKSGATAIPVGATSMHVGFGIAFEPAVVRVSVRQPSSENDIVHAEVVGSPTDMGFDVVFTAEVPSAGYFLDWTAFGGGEISPASGDSLAVSYTDLQREVAAFLGYDQTNLNERETAEIDRYIQSGVRQFYYPPMMEGVDPDFEWSFVRQHGELEVTAGIADYTMPDGFNRIAGHLVFADRTARSTVPVIPYGTIEAMRSANMSMVGRPKYAAVMAKNAFGEHGQKHTIHLFPTPDDDYTMTFVCDADTGKIDPDERPFPLGGAMFAELVTESCLAIAEQKANDEIGAHTAKFQQLLVSTIQRDRKSTAQNYGFVGDPDGFRW